jgi:hypothetical protein
MYGGGGWGGWYPWYWFMSSSMICTIRILETTLQGIGNKMALHPPPRPPPLPPPPLDVTTVRGTSAPQSPDLPIPRLESARRRSVSASPPLLPAPSLVASVIGPGLPFVGSIVPCCAHRHRLVGVAPRSLLGHFWAVNRQIRPPRHRGSPDPSSSPLVSVGAWPLKGGGGIASVLLCCREGFIVSTAMCGAARPLGVARGSSLARLGRRRWCGPHQAGRRTRPRCHRLTDPSMRLLDRPGRPHANVHRGSCSLVALIPGAFVPCCLG